MIPLECPCAESRTIASTPASTKASTRSICPTPIAAATRNLPKLSLFASGYSLRFLRSFMVISPSKRPCSSTIGSFSTLFLLKIFSASSKVHPLGAVIKGALVITFSTKFE